MDGIKEKTDQLALVYGNKERIYINLEIGCEAECSYCYVGSIRKAYQCDGLRYDGDDVMDLIRRMGVFVEGEGGTVLSFGCYSECMSVNNRSEIVRLVTRLAGMGNYIQLATKKEISRKEERVQQ